MATNVADLIATLRMDVGQFTRGAETAQRAALKLTSQISMTTLGLSGMESQIAKLPTNLSNIGKQAETTGSKFGAMGKAMVAAFSIVAIKQVADFGAAMFRVGMESEAFQRKYEAVFGANTAALDAWVTEHHSSFGKAEDEVQGYLAQIGNLLTGMGNTAEEAGAQATKILELAGAWSAWSGGQISVQDASDKLVKGMMGQTRGLIDLGLKVTEQEVNARMAAEGLDTLTGAEASRAQQQVMWTLIQEKSTTAVGAYDEALGGAYGTSMELSTAMDEVKDAVGRMVVAAAPALEKLVPIVTAIAEAIEGIGFSHAAQNTEHLAELWGQVLAGSAEESATAVDDLKGALGLITTFMGVDAADKTVYLINHVNGLRTAYDQLTTAALGFTNIFAFLGPKLPVPEPSNIAFSMQMPKGMGTKWAEAIYSEMVKKWESIPSKTFGSKWAFSLVDNVDEALNTLPALIAAHEGDVAAAAADLFEQIAKQEQFAKDIRTLTDRGLEEIVRSLTSGPVTDEVMEAARALASGEGNAYADELNYLMAWATTNAAWLASPEHANWQAVTDAYVAAARAIGIAYQGTLSPYLLVNPTGPNNGGTEDRRTGHWEKGVWVWDTRAAGGPVYPGNPYLVGEQGPELFMPNQSGQIIPNNRLRGGTPGTTQTVHVHVAGSVIAAQELAKIVEDQMIRSSRRGASSEVY